MPSIAESQKQLMNKAVGLEEAAKKKLAEATVEQDARQAERNTLTKRAIELSQQQAAAAQAGVGRAEQAQRDAMLATRADAGKVLAQSRGMLGGGAGLAMMRGAALDRGAAESKQRAEHAAYIQDAVQRAAQAKSEALEEEGKALAAKELEGINAATARNEAEDIAKAVFADNYYTSEEDINQAVSDIRARAAMKATPAEREAMLRYADELAAGQHDYANKAGF